MGQGGIKLIPFKGKHNSADFLKGTGPRLTQRKRGLPDQWQNLLLILPLVFLLFFLYQPLAGLYTSVFDKTGGSGWSRITDELPYYGRIFRFTLIQALLSTAASLLAGLPGAWILARFQFPGKKFLRSLTTLPFVMPSILVVLGFILLWGKSGFISRILGFSPGLLYSMKAIILAHVFYNFPIAIRFISQYWETLSTSQEQAARSLGAGKIKSFLTITLPQLMPAVLSAATLIFLYCFMSFAIILVLGGGPKFTTIEVEIYHLARFSFDMKSAGILSLAESVITLLILSWHLGLEKKMQGSSDRFFKPEYKAWKYTGKSFRLLIIIYFTVVLFFLIMPLILVMVQSFQARNRGRGELIWTMKWYKTLLSPGGRGQVTLTALYNSLKFALWSLIIGIPTGALIGASAHKKNTWLTRLTELSVMLPMGISSIILGLVYLRFKRDTPWLKSQSELLIILAHTISALPFTVKSLKAGFSRIQINLKEAASGLGAGRWQYFRDIEFPLVRSSFSSAAAFAFAISIGEINATLMLSDKNTITLPLAIYRLIGSYNFFGACAMGTILMFFCFVIFYLTDQSEVSA